MNKSVWERLLMPISWPRKQRGQSSRLAADLDRIIAYGRVQLDPTSNDHAAYSMLEADLYPVATSAPDAFSRELADLVMPVGGVAVYGGARLAGSLLGYSFEGAAYLELLDAALQWRHDTGTGAAWIAPYEMRRWEHLHGPASW